VAAGDEQFTPEAAQAVLGDGERAPDLSDAEQTSARHSLMDCATSRSKAKRTSATRQLTRGGQVTAAAAAITADADAS